MTSQTQSVGSTSSSLLRRVQQNDADAWRRLAALYGPLIYGWCRRRGLQPADASDVAQEVFRGMISGIMRLRHGTPGTSFRGWLWTVTQFTASAYQRKTRRQPIGEGGSNAHGNWQRLAEPNLAEPNLAEPDPQRDEGQERLAIMQRALAQLRSEFEPHTWEAFWQLTTGTRSAAEIGAELGMTPAAVRQAKFRVLKRLRVELEGLLD